MIPKFFCKSQYRNHPKPISTTLQNQFTKLYLNFQPNLLSHQKYCLFFNRGGNSIKIHYYLSNFYSIRHVSPLKTVDSISAYCLLSLGAQTILCIVSTFSKRNLIESFRPLPLDKDPFQIQSDQRDLFVDFIFY